MDSGWDSIGNYESVDGFDCHTISCPPTPSSGITPAFKVTGTPVVSSSNTGGFEAIWGYFESGSFYGNAYTAVSLYCSDPASAISTYGPIEDWGMGGVWDFTGLFRYVSFERITPSPPSSRVRASKS